VPKAELTNSATGTSARILQLPDLIRALRG
jgi:hypothetical protein